MRGFALRSQRQLPSGLGRGVALLELWAKSYVEYKRGDCRLSRSIWFSAPPFWRLMNFPPLPFRAFPALFIYP